MGLRDVFPGVQPWKVIADALNSPDEKVRRKVFAERIQLLEDRAEGIVESLIDRLFSSPAVKDRMKPFAHLAVSQAVFKRNVNEVAGTAYSTPPTRYVSLPGANEPVETAEDVDLAETDSEDGPVQENFAALVKETRLNERMNHLAHRLKAANHGFNLTRHVERLNRIVIDVITPECCTVIWDPDDQCKPLSFTYDKPVYKRVGKDNAWGWVTHHVTYDDSIVFEMDENDQLVGSIQEHGFHRMPVVSVRLTEGYGWNDGTGRALVAADKTCKLMHLLSARLLKAQGFNRDAISGDIIGIPKSQALDEESAVVLPEGTTIQQIGSKQDAAHYIQMLDAVKTSAAADEGISRARLNQDKAEDSSDVGLMEARASMIKVLLPAEQEQFEVLKMVAAAANHPSRLPLDAMMEIDFGELQHRVDRPGQLAIWEQEITMGLRSIYDCIREDNPEIRTDEEAQQEIVRNAKARAWVVDLMRALNVRTDGNVTEPGQTPEQNGAMGPPVRDGNMTRDEAADRADGETYEQE
jgi:hypothetical protein